MDLIYMSEAMAYQSIRGPSYERYEYQQQPSCSQARSDKPSVPEGHSSGEKCKICKEKQRRILASFIRMKSTGCSVNNKIVEEEEDICGS